MTGPTRALEDVTKRLLDGLQEVEFSARLSVSLAGALTVLAGQRRPGVVRARSHPAWRLRTPIAAGIALVAVTGGATASSLWLSPAGNPRFGFNPGLSGSAPPAAQLGVLGVLRRTQTDGDRGTAVRAALQDVNNFTTGLRSNYVRVLATAGGRAVVLVPVFRRNAGAGPAQPAIRDALCVYYPFAGSGAPGNSMHCWTTAEVRAGRAVAGIGTHEYGLAPDGVRTVHVSVRSWSRTVRVRDNFFDVRLPGGATRPSQASGVPVAPRLTFAS